MSTIEKIRGIKDDQCAVDVLLKEVTGHKCSSCGKCVFGYEGATQIAMILKDFTEKKARSGDLDLIRDACYMMKTQSLCEDGEDLADAVTEAMETWKQDFEEHAAKKACRAGVCRKFVTYHILADMCTGCGDCVDECDDDAILGKKRFVHVIVQEECVQCGKCLEACDEDAIVTAGAVKPRCPKKPIPCKRR